MTITRAAIMAGIFLAAFARAREGTFPGVEQSIQERTGKMVRWEVDQAAHEQTLRDVRLLLRKPLTVESAGSCLLALQLCPIPYITQVTVG